MNKTVFLPNWTWPALVLLISLSFLPYSLWEAWGKYTSLLLGFFILFIGIIFSSENGQSSQRTAFKRTPLDIPIILFFLVIFISLKKSLVSEISAEEFITWINCFFIYFFAANLKNKKHSLLIKTVVFWGILFVGFGFYQRFFLQVKNIDGNFANPNIFAGFLILVIPVIFLVPSPLVGEGRVRGNKSRDAKFCVSTNFVGAIFLIALFLTGSLGGIFSLLLAWLVFYWSKFNQKVRIALLLIIGLALIWVLWTKFQQPGVYNRLIWWQGALRMIGEHPWFGVGLGGFGRLYLKYKTAGLNSTYAHNFYLQLASEIGIIGLLIFLWLIYRFWRFSPFSGIKIGIAAALIHNFVEYNLFLSSNGFTFWLFLGMGIGALEPTKVNLKLSRISFLILAGFMVLAAEINLLKFFWAKQNLSWAGNALLKNNLSQVWEKSKIVLKYNPYSSTAHYYLYLVFLGKYSQEKYSSYLDEAVLELRSALSLEPHNSRYWGELGKLYLSKGEEKLALESALKAVENNFYNSGSHRMLADVYSQLGDKQSAEKETAIAEGLD
ncbi:MAG: O-antigen ligase family protein [Elusimicrobiota bacterium]